MFVRSVAAVLTTVALAGVVGCTGLVRGGVARVGLDDWIEVRTPNFVIRTALARWRAERMAERLELFRSVVEFIVGRQLPTSRIPTTVFAFDSKRDYADFAPDALTIAHFNANLRGNLVVLPGSDPSFFQHEYVHQLIDADSVLVYPKWYNEGFAEFLGATRIEGDEVVIGGLIARPGRFPSSLVGHPRWAPLEAIFEHGSDGSDEPDLFYEQSWAFVHFLYIGPGAQREPRKRVARYIQTRGRGRSVRESVRHGFGVDVDRLDEMLRKYLSRDRFTSYSVDRSRFGESAPTEVSAVAPDEVALDLARIATGSGRPSLARAYYDEALARNPNSARALCGVANHPRDDEDPEHLWNRALAAGGDDPIVRIEYGNSRFGMAFDPERGPEEREALLEEARGEYVRSLELDASSVEARLQLGKTFLVEGQDASRGREAIEEARALAPGSLDVLATVARLHFVLSEPEQARSFALRVYSSAHGDRDEGMVAILEATGGMPGAPADVKARVAPAED